MSFEKLKPLTKDEIHFGCTTCSTAAIVAPMEMAIAVGFGSAYLPKDNEIIFDENDLDEDEAAWTVQDAEDLALKDPDHDWRIVKFGPLHGETFQRQGDGNWVCVESNMGFA